MRKTTQTISEIGLFAALGFILDEVQGLFFKGIFINGGSIGIAMIAVIIIGFRRGFIPALVTGLIMGLFDIASNAYIVHPLQLFLDYIFPYTFVSLSALFKNKLYTGKNKLLILILASIVGGFGKLLSHYLAGVFFWADQKYFAWGLTTMNPYLYSFIYNFAFIGPSIVLTSILILFIYKRNNKILLVNEKEKACSVYQYSKKDYCVPTISFAFGLALFISFLILYIQSYSFDDYGDSFEYSFNKICMVIFIIGILYVCVSGFSLFSIYKKTYSKFFYLVSIIFINAFALVFSIVELSKLKSFDLSLIILLSSAFILFCLYTTLLILNKKKKTNNSANL